MVKPTTIIILLFPFILMGQESKSFYFPPALELVLDETEWKKRKLTYSEAMWTPSQKKMFNTSKNIVISINCNLIEYLDYKPDSIFAVSESTFKYRRIEYSKSTINSFSLISPAKENDQNIYYFEATAIHPDGYFVAMGINISNLGKEKSDNEVAKIMNGAKLVAPNYIDKKLGYPLSSKTNLDSIFNDRINTLRKKYKNYYSSQKLEKELSKVKKENLIPEYYDTLSFDRLYSISKKIMRGNLNIDETLDYSLLNKKSNDIALYEKYLGGNHGEPLGIISNKQLTSLLDHDFSNYSDLSPKNFVSCNKNDTIFWSLLINKRKDSLTVFSFVKRDRKWIGNFKSFQNNSKDLEASIVKDYSGEFRNDCDENQTGSFIIVGFYEKHPLTNYLIGSRKHQNTNFLTMHHQVAKKDEFYTTYYIRDFDYPHGKVWSRSEAHLADISDSIVYTTHINKTIKEKFSFKKIQSNKKLRKMIDPSWTLNYRQHGYETLEDFERRKQEKVERKILENHLLNSPPKKRLYVSNLRYSDIDQDGY